MFGKLDEYKGIESPTAILLVEPNAPAALLGARDADRSWSYRSFNGLDGTIELPDLGVALPMSEIYADLTFGPEETRSLAGGRG